MLDKENLIDKHFIHPQVTIDDLQFLTRIYYKAPSDTTWGEHEIDYILFVQKDVTVVPNPNEVMSQKYVSEQELKDILAEGERGDLKITPWFKLICDSHLFKWWGSIKDLSSFVEKETIHRMV